MKAVDKMDIPQSVKEMTRGLQGSANCAVACVRKDNSFASMSFGVRAGVKPRFLDRLLEEVEKIVSSNRHFSIL